MRKKCIFFLGFSIYCSVSGSSSCFICFICFLKRKSWINRERLFLQLYIIFCNPEICIHSEMAVSLSVTTSSMQKQRPALILQACSFKKAVIASCPAHIKRMSGARLLIEFTRLSMEVSCCQSPPSTCRRLYFSWKMLFFPFFCCFFKYFTLYLPRNSIKY